MEVDPYYISVNNSEFQYSNSFLLFEYLNSELQANLIRSHAAGVGKPLTLNEIRMIMALRINVLAKGYR